MRLQEQGTGGAKSEVNLTAAAQPLLGEGNSHLSGVTDFGDGCGEGKAQDSHEYSALGPLWSVLKAKAWSRLLS